MYYMLGLPKQGLQTDLRQVGEECVIVHLLQDRLRSRREAREKLRDVRRQSQRLLE